MFVEPGEVKAKYEPNSRFQLLKRQLRRRQTLLRSVQSRPRGSRHRLQQGKFWLDKLDKILHSEVCWALENVPRKAIGNSLLEDFQNWAEQGSSWPDLTLKLTLLWTGIWIRWAPESHSNLNYFMILWFPNNFSSLLHKKECQLVH